MKTLLAASILTVGLAASMADVSPSPRTTRSAAPTSAAEPDLASLREATLRYRDVNVALKEGYVRDPMNLCDKAEDMGKPAELGVMGIHFARPDLLGISGPPSPKVSGTGTHTDFSQPSILIYEPQKDGSLQLVAIENLVFIKAWEAAGHTAPPSYQGVPYDRMADDPATTVDEAHMFEPHYDRHVWVHRDNPKGVFAQFNPNATCKYHTGGGHTH
jgi:hypothetical protein